MFPFILFLSVSSPIYVNSPCPAIQPVKNFNLTAFAAAKWYEIARYPGDYEKDGDCVILDVKTENGVTKYNLTEVANQKISFFEGNVYLPRDNDRNGAVYFHSPTFINSDGVIDLPVYFLDIDYNRYYIAYKCKYDTATKTRKDYTWIATRTKIVDPSTKAKIDDFLKSVDQNAHPIDVKKLIWIHFTDESCKVA